MPTYTLAELEDLVWDRTENNRILYTEPELRWVINEALRVLCLFTVFNMDSVHLSGFTVANQLLYAVPDGVVFPTRVAFEGRDLDKIGLTTMGETYRYWATDTTDTYGPVARWIPIGTRQFAIHPIDAIGGNDLTITGMAQLTPLVLPTDIMELEDEQVDLIVEYGGHRLIMKEAGKIFSDASLLIQDFWHAMKSVKRWHGLRMPRYFVSVEQPK